MREINRQTWPRKGHFEFFKSFNHPHFNMCANVNLTKFLPHIKKLGVSFTVAITYVLSRVANAIPEFRMRVRGEKIIEHELVSPSVTILLDNELFSFCNIEYDQDYQVFSERAIQQIKAVKNNPTLENPPGRDDLLYMTAIPWVSFTSFTHPMKHHPADYIPRFAWGKYFEEGAGIKMPLSLQGHHMLMDGIHMGKFYAMLENVLADPEAVIGSRWFSGGVL